MNLFRYFAPILMGLSFLPAIAQDTVQTAFAYDPSNTVFAFDYHNVIGYPSKKKAAKEFWKIVGSLAAWSNILEFKAIRDDYNKLYIETGKGGDDALRKLIELHPCLKPYESYMFAMANAIDVDENVVEIIRYIKSLGYKVYLASNMERPSVEEQARQFPELFALFDDACIPAQGLAALKKPSQQYYINLRAMVDKHNPHKPTIIFIDDNKDNIVAAQNINANIVGIQFKSYKQLYNDLEAKNCYPIIK